MPNSFENEGETTVDTHREYMKELGNRVGLGEEEIEVLLSGERRAHYLADYYREIQPVAEAMAERVSDDDPYGDGEKTGAVIRKIAQGAKIKSLACEQILAAKETGREDLNLDNLQEELEKVYRQRLREKYG